MFTTRGRMETSAFTFRTASSSSSPEPLRSSSIEGMISGTRGTRGGEVQYPRAAQPNAAARSAPVAAGARDASLALSARRAAIAVR